jgi:hypothetical protein
MTVAACPGEIATVTTGWSGCASLGSHATSDHAADREAGSCR